MDETLKPINCYYAFNCGYCGDAVKFNEKDHHDLCRLWENEMKVYCSKCDRYTQYKSKPRSKDN